MSKEKQSAPPYVVGDPVVCMTNDGDVERGTVGKIDNVAERGWYISVVNTVDGRTIERPRFVMPDTEWDRREMEKIGKMVKSAPEGMALVLVGENGPPVVLRRGQPKQTDSQEKPPFQVGDKVRVIRREDGVIEDAEIVENVWCTKCHKPPHWAAPKFRIADGTIHDTAGKDGKYVAELPPKDDQTDNALRMIWAAYKLADTMKIPGVEGDDVLGMMLKDGR